MTRKSIIRLPHPSLRKPSREVQVPSKTIGRLVESMKSAALDWETHRAHEVGVALAAVQLNRLVRVVIIRKALEDKTNKEFDVYINPAISRFEGEPISEVEGCLSVQDIYGDVKRYPRVKIKALDLEGRPVKRLVKGFLARVFQHEIDHTEGLTFVDRVGPSGQYYALDPDGNMRPLKPAQRRDFLHRAGYAPATKKQ